MNNAIYIFLLAILATSCSPKTSEVITPVPEAKVKMPTMELAQGKSIYDSKCNQCHAPAKIDNYTQEQWNKILPDMMIRSKLTTSDAALTQAYVTWELNN